VPLVRGTALLGDAFPKTATSTSLCAYFGPSLALKIFGKASPRRAYAELGGTQRPALALGGDLPKPRLAADLSDASAPRPWFHIFWTGLSRQRSQPPGSSPVPTLNVAGFKVKTPFSECSRIGPLWVGLPKNFEGQGWPERSAHGCARSGFWEALPTKARTPK